MVTVFPTGTDLILALLALVPTWTSPDSGDSGPQFDVNWTYVSRPHLDLTQNC